jgi:hypothetical protein
MKIKRLFNASRMGFRLRMATVLAGLQKHPKISAFAKSSVSK